MVGDYMKMNDTKFRQQAILRSSEYVAGKRIDRDARAATIFEVVVGVIFFACGIITGMFLMGWRM